MKKINEIFSYRNLQSSSRTELDSPNEFIGIKSSLAQKGHKPIEIFNDHKRKMSFNVSGFLNKDIPSQLFNIYADPSFPNINNGKPKHRKYNKSLNDLKDSSISTLSKKKLMITEQKYSPNSRLKEINSLQKENEILKKKLLFQTNALEEVDEFRYSMKELEFSTNFNEKRVNSLKAQILKQQNYITKLEKTFKLMRIFFNDSKSFLNLFIEISSKYQEKLKSRTKDKTVLSLDENLQKMDAETFKEALDKLIRTNKNPDLFKEFIENFNKSFKLILKYERSNKEFEGLFRKTELKSAEKNEKNPLDNKRNNLIYQNPIESFVEKYKSCFNIKTFFNILEPKETEKISVNFENLLVLMKKVEDLFKKLDTFDNFKNNEFYFNTNDDSFKLSHENYENFTDFLISISKTNFIGLNYSKIMEVESDLSLLLNDLVHFEYDFIYKKNEISLNKIVSLQERLRKNVKKLIELGVRLSETEDANLLYLLEKNVKGEREILFKNNVKKNNVPYFLLALKSEEIKKDFKNCCIYIKEFMINLPENVLQDEIQQKKIKKIDYLVDLLTSIYEQNEVFNQILELDLYKQKETNDHLKDSISEIQTFFTQRNNNFNQFFSNIKEKLFELSTQIDSLPEKSSDSLVKKIKKKFEDVLQNLTEIPYENPSEKKMKLNRLFEEYELKFSIMLKKWNLFMNSISKIKDNI